jgi:PAS domain S-box-containing protein
MAGIVALAFGGNILALATSARADARIWLGLAIVDSFVIVLAVIAVLWIRRDSARASQSELRVTRQLAYLRSIVEASIDPLFAVSREGIVTDVNMSATARTGRTRDRLVGAEFAALFADPEAARECHRRAFDEGSLEGLPLVMKGAEGGLANVRLNASVYLDDKGAAVGVLVDARDVTAEALAETERDRKGWVADGIARLNAVFQVQGDTADLARRIISMVADYAGAQVGAFYAAEEDGGLALIASHAYTKRKNVPRRFLPGEGIVGQAALERKQILVHDLPDDYIHVASGLGESPPRNLCVTPLMFGDSVGGVIEIASLGSLSDGVLDFLGQAAPMVAVALEASRSREAVAAALGRSQQLGAELEAQQSALRLTNAELEEQSVRLKESEGKLQLQQAELETSNAELEVQASRLKESEQKLQAQQRELEVTNDGLSRTNELLERRKAEIEEARDDIARKSEEVALASKYKSEFLANMSHELRTPLNSLLLLARSLRDNEGGNLTADQVESAGVIYESGSDLLDLINEILDLSKIEAGKMELRLEEVEIEQVGRSIVSQFEHMAHAQGLYLRVETGPDMPASVVTDGQRMGQILKNLIGNAIKFTGKGGVSVAFGRPRAGTGLAKSGLDPEGAFAVRVSDTGIGIAPDKQQLIFEAFQQADSGDRRRYGGTGLGLSISRELAALLGGEIQLESEPGKGSTFTLYLPVRLEEKGKGVQAEGRKDAVAAPGRNTAARPDVPAAVAARAAAVPDDRDAIGEGDRVMLVIEDDPRFSAILAKIIRERGFKCLVAGTGEEGLAAAREHRPHGVILDIQLPGMDGWAVLDALKRDVSLRHIPVHIVSVEEPSSSAMGAGAIGHAAKPVDKEQILRVLERIEAANPKAAKRVLVVEDDDLVRRETVRIVGNGNVKVDEVTTGKDALDILKANKYELAIIDLGLPDMQGLDLLREVAAAKLSLPPVIIHTARELTLEEEYFLRDYSESIVVKDVRSQERLIDEVALFLHRVVRDMPEDNKRVILHLHESDEPLQGRKVLIVEDDMRTMFAMARMLAGHGVNPLKAENGQRALAMLDEHPDVDLVLLDIMMPVMDGYEALRAIRAQGRFASLPVIALTAKAMKEDRKKCLDAGATDYLSKPVDPDRLTSLMRVLLCR